MTPRDVAVGFLFHPPTRKVLLHLRDPDKPPSAGQWAFFGGHAEPEDGGDLRATWCREMREELGIALDPARVVSLRQGVYATGVRWQDFYYAWPSLDENFVLTEGQRYAWFTLDEVDTAPDVAGYVRGDLAVFREVLGRAVE